MQLKIFSIRDTKTEIYNRPFYCLTNGEAERNFRDIANDDKSKISQHPEDYDLYYLGEFDDNSGKGNWLDTPLHIVKAVNCLNPKQ